MLASWTAFTGTHIPPASLGTAMLLPDGSVLAHGSADSATKNWYRLTPDSSGNYLNGTWTTLAPMSLERLGFPSAILQDGRVLVLGGEYTGQNTDLTITNTGEIYSPQTNSWTSIPNFPQTAFGDDPLVVLNNGLVLAGYIFGAQTYLFNPTTATQFGPAGETVAPNTWVQAGTKLNSDRSDEETWTKAVDGNGHDIVVSYDVYDPPAAQKYDLSTGHWLQAGSTPTDLVNDNFELGPGLRIPDGRVVQFGSSPHNAIYDPVSNTWAALVDTPGSIGGNDAPAAEMPSGHILYAAGDTTTSAGPPTTFFDVDPVNNTSTAIVSPSGGATYNNYVWFNTMLSLPTGQILLTTCSRNTFIYTPDGSASDAWRPSISSIARNGDGTFTLNGAQLGGVSEGASFGDDAQMSTNFPVVQLTDASGNVSYAPTFGWNKYGVGAGGATSTNFTLPAGITGGAYRLRVIASGISSKDFLVVFAGGAAGNSLTVRTDPGNAANVQILSAAPAQSFTASTFVGSIILGTSSADTIVLSDNFNNIPTTVHGGDGDDVININAAAATTSVLGENGNDTISVGGNNMSANILASVSVDGGNNSDSLTYDDSNGTGNDTYSLGNTSLVKSGQPAISFTHGNIEAIALLASNGSNTISVASISIPTTINGGASNDQINIGSGNLDTSITANMSIDGGSGADSVFFNDGSNSGAPSYNLSATSFSKSTLAVSIALANVEGQNLSAGSGADTVNVSAAGTNVTVSGDGGDDAVFVSSQIPGQQVTVSAGGGNDSLFIVGSANADVISVNSTSISGDATVNFDSTLEHLEVDGNAGADLITVNSTSASTAIVIDGGAGNDSILVQGDGANAVTIVDSAGGDNLFINTDNTGSALATLSGNSNPLGTVSIGAGGTMTFSSGAISMNGLVLTGGTLAGSSDVTITSAMTWNAGLLSGAGNLIIASSATMTDSTPGTSRLSRALEVDGHATLTSGGNRLLVLTALTFGAAGKLDLANNDMILDYTGGSQIGAISDDIKSARGAGAWNGPSGLTSSAAASASPAITTLGAMEATDYKTLFPAGIFDGEALDNTAVVVKYTYYGDANFNGKVDGGDYARMDITFGQESAGNIGGWINGDFNYDGRVNGSDYGLADLAFGAQISVLSSPLSTPPAGGDLTNPGTAPGKSGKLTNK